MELVRCTSVFDSEGRFNPLFDTDTTLTIDADCVLLAIGQAPDLQLAEGLLETDGRCLVVTAPGETSLPGVFAGGDAVTGPASVIEAIAAGRRAASPSTVTSALAQPGPSGVHNGDHTSLVNLRTEALSAIPRVQSVSASPSERDMDTDDVATLVFDPSRRRRIAASTVPAWQ